MKKFARLAFVLPLSLLCLCQATDARGGRTAASQKDIDTLAALIRAPSFREADRLAATLLADPAVDAPTMAMCGLSVLKAGRIAEAEAIFDKAISRSPDAPDAHLGLGRIARIRNDAGPAIAHLRRAVPSAAFYEEALRQLWRATWDRGVVAELLEVRELAEKRYGLESLPLPSWITNSLGQIRGLEGKRLFEMSGRSERLKVPLVTAEQRPRIQMIALGLNGKGEYLFDIDSASADFLTVSPLLAEELGLPLTGRSEATGVGTRAAPVRFSVLDKVELGAIAFRNVPVMVSDLQSFRGLKKGLLGTGLLKRFNVTIDVEAGVMDLFPLDQPELLTKNIDRKAVAADVPLYLFDATMVEASLEGAPPALYILDSAAATNLVDGAFFLEHLKPKLDPARIVQGGIQGAQGAQYVNRVDGVSVRLGSLVFDGQQVNEFPMEALNMIPGRYAAGLLGNPLLWPYRVHMDFRAGRLILEKYRKL
jgi:predicted aspartyl protease